MGQVLKVPNYYNLNHSHPTFWNPPGCSLHLSLPGTLFENHCTWVVYIFLSLFIPPWIKIIHPSSWSQKRVALVLLPFAFTAVASLRFSYRCCKETSEAFEGKPDRTGISGSSVGTACHTVTGASFCSCYRLKWQPLVLLITTSLIPPPLAFGSFVSVFSGIL